MLQHEELRVLVRLTAEQDRRSTVGVQGTPTFFVKGTKFTGRASYEGLKAALDQELAK